MDAILFHPETSTAAGVDPRLGDIRYGRTSPGDREPLGGKLLDLYRNDPDAGVHGAAEWTLRQWKQQDKLKVRRRRVDEAQGPRRPPLVREQPGPDLRRDRGAGRVLDGFAADRARPFLEETLHRRRIGRRFAIATKEVSVEQYQPFQRLEIDKSTALTRAAR